VEDVAMKKPVNRTKNVNRPRYHDLAKFARAELHSMKSRALIAAAIAALSEGADDPGIDLAIQFLGEAKLERSAALYILKRIESDPVQD
jgi:hypothetical protein